MNTFLKLLASFFMLFIINGIVVYVAHLIWMSVIHPSCEFVFSSDLDMCLRMNPHDYVSGWEFLFIAIVYALFLLVTMGSFAAVYGLWHAKECVDKPE